MNHMFCFNFYTLLRTKTVEIDVKFVYDVDGKYGTNNGFPYWSQFWPDTVLKGDKYDTAPTDVEYLLWRSANSNEFVCHSTTNRFRAAQSKTADDTASHARSAVEQTQTPCRHGQP